ncbi:hypothetical protein F5Y03DRAFT_399289 [Xylaria venustula]|nr:hypothetical protein F5Y03DRAFT_399289 [Xylaria venustula]
MAISGATTIIILSTVLNAVVVFAVGLRFLARHLHQINLGVDDYTILPGALFVIGIGVATSIGAVSVTGEFGAEELTLEDRRTLFKKMQFVVVTLSVLSRALIKFSVVSLYRRIFRTRVFIHFTTVLLILDIMWGFCFFIAVLLQCVPTHAAWNSAAREHAHCYNPMTAFKGLAISDTIFDVVILFSPIPIVWRLQMPRKQKLAVTAILFLGTFVVDVSAARIYFFLTAEKQAQVKDVIEGNCQY